MKTNFPYLRKRIKNEIVRIEVMADSMRVGKTTAVNVIGEGLRKRGLTVTESYEDWQHNPYLKKSYSDPAKNFLESQKWFIQRKWEQVKKENRECRIMNIDTNELDFANDGGAKERLVEMVAKRLQGEGRGPIINE